MSAPSAFSDSPEDLIAKAEAMIKDAGVPARAGVLISDLARSLEAERRRRAGNFEMIRAHNIEMGGKDAEIHRLEVVNESANKSLVRAYKQARRASLVAMICGLTTLGLGIWTCLR